MKAEDCDHTYIDWEDAPDYTGTNGISMYWFGQCEDCGTPVRERYEPQGVEEIE